MEEEIKYTGSHPAHWDTLFPRRNTGKFIAPKEFFKVELSNRITRNEYFDGKGAYYCEAYFEPKGFVAVVLNWNT